MVFCTLCTSSTHGGGVSEHTVIPFSIAIKRMSEILLFKAKQCMENLNRVSRRGNAGRFCAALSQS